GRPGVGRRVGHREQHELAAEDLLVAGERLAAVAGEGEVRMERHRSLLVSGLAGTDDRATGNSSVARATVRTASARPERTRHAPRQDVKSGITSRAKRATC